MICFKRNILTVLMIFVNFMPFDRVLASNNKGFKNCYYQLKEAFLLTGHEHFVARDSPLYCIKNAIMYLSENDNLDSDLREYYNKFPGKVNGDKIMNRVAFCVEIADAILDPSAKIDPAKYIFQKFKAQTSKDRTSPSMYLFKLSEAQISGDKDEKIEKCVKELTVFGSPFASNDEILDLAIRKYRISFSKEKLDHALDSRSYGCQYLIHISEVVDLKRYTKLITPWNYCRDRHPDKEQENAKPEVLEIKPKDQPKNQASSRKQEIK